MTTCGDSRSGWRGGLSVGRFDDSMAFFAYRCRCPVMFALPALCSVLPLTPTVFLLHHAVTLRRRHSPPLLHRSSPSSPLLLWARCGACCAYPTLFSLLPANPVTLLPRSPTVFTFDSLSSISFTLPASCRPSLRFLVWSPPHTCFLRSLYSSTSLLPLCSTQTVLSDAQMLV